MKADSIDAFRQGIASFMTKQPEPYQLAVWTGCVTMEDNGGYTDIDFVKEGFQSVKKFLKGEYK